MQLPNEIIYKIENNYESKDIFVDFLQLLEHKQSKIHMQQSKVLSSLKQEGCIYQVVEVNKDGIYLLNTHNQVISKEKNIPSEVLKNIGEDSVLQYIRGKYVLNEKLTHKFFSSLVSVQEYDKINLQFLSNSNISKISQKTQFELKTKDLRYSILEYGKTKTLVVPNILIPFWARCGSILEYINGCFIIKK